MMIKNIHKINTLFPFGRLWSGRPDSNRRPSAWKADTLAAELLPHKRDNYNINYALLYPDTGILGSTPLPLASSSKPCSFNIS